RQGPGLPSARQPGRWVQRPVRPRPRLRLPARSRPRDLVARARVLHRSASLMPELPKWVRYLLAAIVSMLAVAPVLLPISDLAQGIIALVLTGFAAVGIVPPQKS